MLQSGSVVVEERDFQHARFCSPIIHTDISLVSPRRLIVLDWRVVTLSHLSSLMWSLARL